MFRDIVYKILEESKLLSSDSNGGKIFTTKNLYDIFIYCRNEDSSVRVYYDINKNLYLYSLANFYIHFDIAQEAYFQGLYPEYVSDKSNLQGIHIIDKQGFCFVVAPYYNDKQIKEYDEEYNEDGYDLSKTLPLAGVKIYYRTDKRSKFPSEKWAEKLFSGLE